MAASEILDPRGAGLFQGSAHLDHLASGLRWAEGPVYVPAARSVIWSDIPNDRLMRFDETTGTASVFETPCGYHNGHTLDAEGRIIACEHGGRRIARLDHDGLWRTLVGRVDGKRLNSPNDVVVKSDGSIWFTDPTYGIDSDYEGHAAASEIGASYVYRHDPASGTTTAVITDRVQPNGLAFSPDESLLYVADTGSSHKAGHPRSIDVYRVAADGRSVTAQGPFAECPSGVFDGFRLDAAGNLWASSQDAVLVYAPDATLIGRIPIPETVSNLCFGGPKRNRLYITATTSLYAIYVNARPPGWQWRPDAGAL